MPYRSELKRPDLKGQFPCSVCGKIFCHSSSLSRHRMQAHFKSYLCMQCNQEISSNETLRSHMMRNHQIARMFMCRCCNWAFPDKTSLHLHTTSLAKTGKPGDVAVLARSFAEGDDPYNPEIFHNTPSSSPPDPRDSISPSEREMPTPTANNILNGVPAHLQIAALTNPVLQSPANLHALLTQINLMKCAQEKQNNMKAAAESMNNRVPAAEFIAQWMANNPFSQIKNEHSATPKPSALAVAAAEELLRRKRVSSSPSIDACSVKLMKTDHETSEPSTSPTQIMDHSMKGGDLSSSSLFNPNDSNNNGDSGTRKNKRKANRPRQLQTVEALNLSTTNSPSKVLLEVPVILTANTTTATTTTMDFDEKKNSESECGMSEQNQLSPAVSDSHTSGSGNDTTTMVERNNKNENENKLKIYKERLRNIETCTSKFAEAAAGIELLNPQISELLNEIKGYCRV